MSQTPSQNKPPFQSKQLTLTTTSITGFQRSGHWKRLLGRNGPIRLLARQLIDSRHQLVGVKNRVC